MSLSARIKKLEDRAASKGPEEDAFDPTEVITQYHAAKEVFLRYVDMNPTHHADIDAERDALNPVAGWWGTIGCAIMDFLKEQGFNDGDTLRSFARNVSHHCERMWLSIVADMLAAGEQVPQEMLENLSGEKVDGKTLEESIQWSARSDRSHNEAFVSRFNADPDSFPPFVGPAHCVVPHWCECFDKEYANQ